MFQSHEYGSWALGGEECGDDCLEELFGLFWVDLSKEIGVDFGVSGIVLGLAADFLSGLSGVLSGVLGEDGVVTDGVDGGAFGGAFLRRVFGFPFGSWATLGLSDGFGDGGSLGSEPLDPSPSIEVSPSLLNVMVERV